MNASLFQGRLVRLAAIDPDADSAIIAGWSRDSEYWRLITSRPAQPVSAAQVRDRWRNDSDDYEFAVRTLAEDRLIGQIGVWPVWAHRDAWHGVNLGEREYWGKGYGTDALQVMLRYAFIELGLDRVSLSVLGINARAIRAYEKIGFVHEGRTRRTSRYDGHGLDDVYMGLLRSEWVRLSLQADACNA